MTAADIAIPAASHELPRRTSPWHGFDPACWRVDRFPSAAVFARIIRRRRAAAESYLHGWRHWRGVAAVGCRLATETRGADMGIVALFALLHDVERHDDGDDRDHGARAACLVGEIGNDLGLTDRGIALLSEACRYHNGGWVSDDPTIGTCWDSDRLTLSRVGITPRTRYLSTEAARKPRFLAFGKRIAEQPPSWAYALHHLRAWEAGHYAV